MADEKTVFNAENFQKVMEAVKDTGNNIMSKSVSENINGIKSIVEDVAESAKNNANSILNKSIAENAENLKSSVLENVDSLKNSVKETETYKRIQTMTEKDVRNAAGNLKSRAQEMRKQISSGGFMQGPGRDGPTLDRSFVSIAYFLRDLVWVFLLTFPIIFKAFIGLFKERPEKDIKGKVVVVTGAARGLGRELALQFAQEGCKVACSDITYDSTKDTALSIIYSTGRKDDVKSYACDVSDPKQTRKLCDDVIRDFGTVDIVVSNAGYMYGHEMTAGSDEDVKKVIDVNLTGNFWMVRSFLPKMMEKKSGHLVFINSASAFVPIANATSYSASKAGLLGMAIALEEELRRNSEYDNIKLSSVHPYFVATNPEYVDRWHLRIPEMPLKPTVQHIVKGIKKEYSVFQVPLNTFGYWLSGLFRVLPQELVRILKNVFYVDLLNDESGFFCLPLKEKSS